MDTNTPIFGIIRTVLAIAVGYFVSRGKIEQSAADQLIAGIAGIGIAAWSTYSKPRK